MRQFDHDSVTETTHSIVKAKVAKPKMAPSLARVSAMSGQRSAVRAVVALAKLLRDANVESPKPVKSLLSAFSLAIYAVHTPPLLALTPKLTTA
jgi:hypothetical protein